MEEAPRPAPWEFSVLFSEPPSEGAKLEPDCGPQQETTALANASFHPGVNYASNTNAIQYLVFKQFSVYEKLVTLAMNLTSEQLPKKLKVDGKYLKPQRKGSLPTYILSLVGWAGPDVGPDFLGWPVSDGRTDAHPKMGFWSTQFCTSPLSQSSPALKPRPRLVLGPLSAREGAWTWAGLRGRGHTSQPFRPVLQLPETWFREDTPDNHRLPPPYLCILSPQTLSFNRDCNLVFCTCLIFLD